MKSNFKFDDDGFFDPEDIFKDEEFFSPANQLLEAAKSGQKWRAKAALKEFVFSKDDLLVAYEEAMDKGFVAIADMIHLEMINSKL